jgi:hypothetical protein
MQGHIQQKQQERFAMIMTISCELHHIHDIALLAGLGEQREAGKSV